MDALAFIQPELDEQQRQHELMRVLYVRFETSDNAQEAARVYRILTRFVKKLIPNSLDTAPEEA